MDDGGCSALVIIAFFILLGIEVILEGFDYAIRFWNEKDIETNAEDGNDKRYKYLLEITKHSSIYFNTIKLVSSLIYVLMGYIYLPVWTQFFERITGLHYVSLIIACFLLMYVLLTFGYLIPARLAKKYPDKWSHIFIRSVRFLKNILSPLTGLVFITAKGVLFILGQRSTDEQMDVTEEEIISMVNEGHEQGVLEANEAEMITNIFEYGDKKASDIMTHRNNIVALDSHMPFKDALSLMLAESNSRYPVYDENLDHIVGILYLKDAMRFHTSDESLNREIGRVEGLLRDAVFVPETKNINDLFESMQSKKIQMVIVMDEYGQTAGLVTMEDILEEIVGNIMDEYDHEENHIEETGNNEYLIEGMTRLEDLEERFGIDFGDCEFETLNGYLISKLDRIPDENDESEIIYQGYSFKIKAVEKNVIQLVLVTKLPEDSNNEIEQA